MGVERWSVFLMEGLGAWVRIEGWPHRLTSLTKTSSHTDEALKGSQDRGQVGVTASKAQSPKHRMCVCSGVTCPVWLHMLWKGPISSFASGTRESVQTWLVDTSENRSEHWGSLSGPVSGQQVQAHCEDGGWDFLGLFADMIMYKDVQTHLWLQRGSKG